jgi:hypothetical protein
MSHHNYLLPIGLALSLAALNSLAALKIDVEISISPPSAGRTKHLKIAPSSYSFCQFPIFA